MELIRYIKPAGNTGQCVMTIGNFDGVHLGHQSVFAQLKRSSAELGLPSVVMTFEPLPLEYFSPATAPARLTSFRDKVELFKELGIDKVVCLHFDKSLASRPAEAFVRELLIAGLGVKRLIVGDDFRFGKNREGTFELLAELGKESGFDVIPTETYDYNGVRVSSSLVRGHLALNDFQYVRELLGRPYSISGTVVHGDKRGRKLGFPTANIALKRVNTPLSGVYAVRVHGLDNTVYHGAANIGTRPVFDGKQLLMETFILDFDRAIYGKCIRVEFMKHLRNEEYFSSVEALCDQMNKDVQNTREYFRKLGAMNKPEQETG